jgi:hypothetical protein
VEKKKLKERSEVQPVQLPPPPSPDCDVTEKTDKDDLCSLYVAKMYPGMQLAYYQYLNRSTEVLAKASG